MPALNYQRRFAPMVKDGTKRQTMRKNGKRRYHEGDTLYHYTGQRTKGCKMLDATVCTGVYPVTVKCGGVEYKGHNMIAGSRRAEEFAVADGFATCADLIEWTKETHGLPFEGRVITW